MIRTWVREGWGYSTSGHVQIWELTYKVGQTWGSPHVLGPGRGEEGEGRAPGRHAGMLPWCAGEPGLENFNGPGSWLRGGVRHQASTCAKSLGLW